MQKSNNLPKLTQHHKQNLTRISYKKNLKICLFTNFTATGSSISLVDLILEFFERIKIFIFFWNLIPQKTCVELACHIGKYLCDLKMLFKWLSYNFLKFSSMIMFKPSEYWSYKESGTLQFSNLVIIKVLKVLIQRLRYGLLSLNYAFFSEKS